MFGRLIMLVAITMVIWLPAGVLSRWLWGDEVAMCSLIAAGVCLVPSAVTLLWAGWALHQSPFHQLGVVVGGTGLRVVAVVAAALALHVNVPFVREQPSFWWWIVFFYLVTLAVETTLVVVGQLSPTRPAVAPHAETATGTAEKPHGA